MTEFLIRWGFDAVLILAALVGAGFGLGWWARGQRNG